MKTLCIYPTARAIRQALESYKQCSGFIPTLMTMGEFEQKAMVVPNKTLVDPIVRAFYLKEATKFEAFERLKIDRDILRFYTKSEDIFKFLEELSHENVDFERLKSADSYSEFGEHIAILEQVATNYQLLLESKGLTDKFLIPQSYQLNDGFIANYSSFELYLEGYLNPFKLKLIEQIAVIKPFVIDFTTTKFTHKVQKSFAAFGMILPDNCHLRFDMHTKQIVEQTSITPTINATIYKVQERLEQIPIALEAIQRMVNDGIEPTSIAFIVPDERFKESLFAYDRLQNFNFLMGFDYTKSFGYKRLDAFYRYILTQEKSYYDLMVRYGMDSQKIMGLNNTTPLLIHEFFEALEVHKLIDKTQKIVEQNLDLQELFSTQKALFREWLSIYLKVISRITIDDIRGGKITVMGALESRGVAFEGVVIVDFNEDIIPLIPSKDRFLNTQVRLHAALPTRSDREALQKYFYQKLLLRAKQSVIIYPSAQNRLLSKFAYELGLESIESANPNLDLLHVAAPPPLQEEIEVENFNPYALAWSATMLKSFLKCKRQFYYKYIQKIPQKSNEAFNEGLFLHQLLEKLMSNSMNDTQTHLNTLLDEMLGNSAKATLQKQLYVEKLMHFVEYQALHHFSQGYRIELKEKSIEGTIAGLRFKGVIDRLDIKGDEAMVIDYKSGSTANANRTKNLEKLDDFQMSIYAFLLREQYPKLSFAFFKILENEPIEPFQELDAKNDLLFEHIENIKNTTHFTASKCDNLALCIHCPYPLLCERGEYAGR
jgi:CRISPR/Cas system-associated exonuclease Cas4 (RecB family)